MFYRIRKVFEFLGQTDLLIEGISPCSFAHYLFTYV